MSTQDEGGPPRERKIPGGTCEAQRVLISTMSNVAENTSFCGNPGEYDWTCIGKRETVVPCNGDAGHAGAVPALAQPRRPDMARMRWETHNVWVVEGLLQPGESNMLVRRRFYIDEISWAILLGEGYDAAGRLTKYYICHGDLCSGDGNQGQWYPA